MGNNPSASKASASKESSYPVECVTWNECQEFIEKINERYASSGMRFRLPSEADWEYACRAGTRGKYNVPGADLYGLAWFGENSGDITTSVPHKVGDKEPNEWGLYDMHGNVSEWCYDAYSVYGKAAPQNAKLRVTRGGNYGSGAENCRSAKRDYFPQDSRFGDLGFRIELVYVSE